MTTKSIAIHWNIEDVLSVRSHLTIEQAGLVLDYTAKYHDANVGINWEVLKIVADNLFPQEV